MTELLMDGLFVEPTEHPYEISMVNDKDIIEFNLVENIEDACEIKIMRISPSACIIYNKYAILNQGNANRTVNNTIIAGNFYIVGLTDKGKLASLTKNQKLKYTNKFWESEQYTDDDITNAHLASLLDE